MKNRSIIHNFKELFSQREQSNKSGSLKEKRNPQRAFSLKIGDEKAYLQASRSHLVTRRHYGAGKRGELRQSSLLGQTEACMLNTCQGVDRKGQDVYFSGMGEKSEYVATDEVAC